MAQVASRYVQPIPAAVATLRLVASMGLAGVPLESLATGVPSVTLQRTAHDSTHAFCSSRRPNLGATVARERNMAAARAMWIDD